VTILRISHIGVAVSSLDEGSALWTTLGLSPSHQEEVASARTRVSFHPVGESNIELLEAMDPDSPVGRYVHRHGPGIHHLCLEVDDIRAEMRRLSQAGLRLLSPDPQAGAHNTLVCFLHPADTGGVLIELNQTEDPSA